MASCVQICFLIILLRNNSVNASENTEIYKITDRVLSCSKWLSSIIDNICNNVYKIVKRDTSVMMEKLIPKDLQEHTNHERLRTADNWRRVRRQVASECCERACTIGDIIMYCPDDAKLLRENPDILN